MVGPVFKRVAFATLLLLGMIGPSAFAVDLPASVKAIKYPDIPFGISPNRAIDKFGLQKELLRGDDKWWRWSSASRYPHIFNALEAYHKYLSAGEGADSRLACLMNAFYFYSNTAGSGKEPHVHIDANGGIYKDFPRNIKIERLWPIGYDFFTKSRLIAYKNTLSAFYQYEKAGKDTVAVYNNQKTDEAMKALIVSISAKTRVDPDNTDDYVRGASYKWDDGAMLITLSTSSTPSDKYSRGEGYILYESKNELAAIDDYNKRKAQAETDAAKQAADLPASIKAIKYPDIPFGISPNRAIDKFGLQKEFAGYFEGNNPIFMPDRRYEYTNEAAHSANMYGFSFYSNEVSTKQKPYINANRGPSKEKETPRGTLKDLEDMLKGMTENLLKISRGEPVPNVEMPISYDFFMKSRLIAYKSNLSAVYQDEKNSGGDTKADRAANKEQAIYNNQKTDEAMKALIASISAKTRVAPDNTDDYVRGASYQWDDGAMLITLETPSTPEYYGGGYILYESKNELAAIDDYNKRKAQADIDAAKQAADAGAQAAANAF